jgi:serine protease
VPGYDFISDSFMGNDGTGRDSNPADPGDWVAANECYPGNAASDSSWHGTHVAGTIGAVSNNNLGVTGVNWNAKILPVRVLGKCGGTTSDIVDAMRWSAGLSVAGVPDNANPADVLNLSLGGSGTCDITQQNAIDAIVAAGTTVVIAAGNENLNASGFNPGNCNNIITVAATNKTGSRAYYSNYGSVIEVSAPGGAQSFANDPNGILSTLDSGTTAPVNDNAYVYYQGTSMATPNVAGVASLIKGMRPGYTPAQVLALLQSTARSFPAGSTCNTSICGSGIVDAYQALQTLDVTLTEFVYLPMITKSEPPPPPACVPQSGESNNVNDALTTCSGHTATGQVSSADIDDVYKIQMTANQTLSIVMTGSGGDADLYLYSPGTTDVTTDAPVDFSATDGNNESLSGKVLTSGYWYIDVYSYDGTTSYSVTATVTNALTGEVNTFLLTPEDMHLGSRSNK